MAIEDGDIRASHTVRIFGTNKDGEILTDIWLDLERIDVIYVTTKIIDQWPTLFEHWQGVFLRLYWLDDPEQYDTENGAGNPARVRGNKKICSPDEEDQEDPVEWVPVANNIEMDMDAKGDFKVFSRIANRTDGENFVRLVAARRCFHQDTTVDEAVEKLVKENPDWKQIVFPSNKYDFIEKTTDKNTYIEVQYMSATMKQSSRREDNDNRKEQWVQFSLKNSHYLNFTEEAKGPANQNHGFDPPWALDPFQTIVNVQWGGQAVEFFDRDE